MAVPNRLRRSTAAGKWLNHSSFFALCGEIAMFTGQRMMPC
jgi:hypothetical protein